MEFLIGLLSLLAHAYLLVVAVMAVFGIPLGIALAIGKITARVRHRSAPATHKGSPVRYRA